MGGSNEGLGWAGDRTNEWGSHFCRLLLPTGGALGWSDDLDLADDDDGVDLDADAPSPCPVAFQHIGGRCYFYGDFKLNWFRAMEFCHSFGESVSLACIESAEENDRLKDWLVTNGTT